MRVLNCDAIRDARSSAGREAHELIQKIADGDMTVNEATRRARTSAHNHAANISGDYKAA